MIAWFIIACEVGAMIFSIGTIVIVIDCVRILRRTERRMRKAD